MTAGHPVVAIVGRPNVGKSALFNRITGKQISLVYDRPGVTRDRIVHECLHEGKPFTLIDTGGIGLEDESGFEEAIENEVSLAQAAAGQILLVVDGRAGINPLDEEIAQRLRRDGHRVWLVVNKMDSAVQEHWESEFVRLGLGRPYPVSAAHGRGIAELMLSLSRQWPEQEAVVREAAERPVRIAIVGKPNVGKSSLINAVLNEERVIVSPIAGTTRDAVDVFFRDREQNYCLIDTAGLRKRGRVKDALEQAMGSRTAHMINRSDLCVLVLDAERGVELQDKKIGGLIHEAKKPCVVVVNKWDLAGDALHAEHERKLARKTGDAKTPGRKSLKDFSGEFDKALRAELFFLDYAPVVFLSAAEKKNLSGLWEALRGVRAELQREIPTGPLNRLVEKALERHPAPRIKGKTLKIYYITRKKEPNRTPVFMAFVNNRKLFTEDYRRYLEQVIRKEYPLAGCPMLWEVKDKQHEKEVRGKPEFLNKEPKFPRRRRRF
jgi:GTP-binding protein